MLWKVVISHIKKVGGFINSVVQEMFSIEIKNVTIVQILGIWVHICNFCTVGKIKTGASI